VPEIFIVNLLHNVLNQELIKVVKKGESINLKGFFSDFAHIKDASLKYFIDYLFVPIYSNDHVTFKPKVVVVLSYEIHEAKHFTLLYLSIC